MDIWLYFTAVLALRVKRQQHQEDKGTVPGGSLDLLTLLRNWGIAPIIELLGIAGRLTKSKDNPITQ